MKLNLTAAALAAPLLLAACGGGEDGPRTVPVTPAPAVSNAAIASVAAAGPLRYGQSARFTVTGANLTSGVTLSSPGCTNGATATAGATATQITMTCTPTASGPVKIDFSPTNGSVQASLTPTVPAPQVRIGTSKGDVVVELYPNNTPITVANFMGYVYNSFYVNKIFHRVLKGFVVQGGGYDAALARATTGAAIKLETGKGLNNTRGTIAMARTDAPDTAAAEFFFNVVDNAALDSTGGGYAVFGKVVSGMDVVDAIAQVPVQTVNSMEGVPVTPVLITSTTQLQ